jgi:hypothetical protein
VWAIEPSHLPPIQPHDAKYGAGRRDREEREEREEREREERESIDSTLST